MIRVQIQTLWVQFSEEIRGAMQNRIANASCLVPPNSDVVLDVSCVEHGRWARRGRAAFEGSGAVMSSHVRHRMNRHVSDSRRASRGFRADQGEVRADVGDRVEFSRAHSPSGAYADYLATRTHDLDELAAAFRPALRRARAVPRRARRRAPRAGRLARPRH